MLNSTRTDRPLWILALCVLIAYLLPYHMHPYMAFYNDWVVAFGLAIALALYAEQKTVSFKLPLIAILPCGLALLILVQSALGMLTVSWEVLFPIAYLMLMALAMILGATMGGSPHKSYQLCTALAITHLIAALLSVAIATMQFIGVESILQSFAMQMPHNPLHAIRPYGNIGQPNQLALLLCFALISIWWLYQRGRIRPTPAICVGATVLWGLALTQSRIGWIIVPLLSICVLFWRNKANFRPISVWPIVGLLALHLTLIIVLPDIASILGNATRPGSERVESNSQRLIFIQQAWQISFAHPWLGAGWYEFGPQQGLIGSDFPTSAYSQHSHNIVLNFAAELGWPITIIVFGGLMYWLVAGYLRRPISTETGFGILFCIAAFAHSLVEFPLWYAYVLLPLGLIMGMMHVEQYGAREIQLRQTYLVAAFCLMSLCLAGAGMDYRRLVLGFRALGWESLGLKADEGSTNKPNFTIFPQFYDYFKFAKNKARAGMPVEEIAFMEHVAHRFGYAPVLMRMSLIYTLNGRPEDAVKTMKTLNRLHSVAYGEAYQAWKGLTAAEPDKYGLVFKAIPMPSPK